MRPTLALTASAALLLLAACASPAPDDDGHVTLLPGTVSLADGRTIDCVYAVGPTETLALDCDFR